MTPPKADEATELLEHEATVDGADATSEAPVLDPHVAAAAAEAAESRTSKRPVWREALDWSELRDTRYGVGPAVIIAMILGFQTFDTFGFSFLTPEIVQQYDISFRSINAVVSMLTFFGPFLGLAVAYYLDRRPRVPVFLLGTFVSGVASLLTSVATTTLRLGATRFADNGVEGAVHSAQFSLLADYYPPQQRGRVFAFVNLMENSGSLMGRLVVGVIATAVGIKLTFVFLGTPLILLGIVGIFVLREPVRGYWERKQMGTDDVVARIEDEPVSFAESFRVTWATRTLRRTFFGLGLTIIGILPFGFFFQFMLSEVYGLNAAARGALFIPAGIAGIVATSIGGGLIDTFSKRSPRLVFAVVSGFTGIFTLAVVVIAFQPPLWLIVALFTIATGGSALGSPATMALVSQVVPPHVRTTGLQVVSLAAVAAGPFQALVAFPVFEMAGYRGVFLLSGIVASIGAFVLGSAGSFFEIDRRNALAAAVASEEWRLTQRSGRGKLLVCRDVTVHYGNVQVLFGVDFDVEEGQIIALLGTNGAGKSTLLRAISGTTEASGGAIVFDGRDITHMPPHEIAQRRVIHMPGGRGVFPGLKVKDNLLLGAWMVPDDEQDARIDEVYAIFPRLSERRDTLAGSLSGGEQQQLSLAQAFLGNPKLLCIDELSLGLSPAVVGELIEIVKEIHERGTTIIIVEQSINVALTLADRAIFMEKGEVKFFGDTKELLSRPDILRAVYVKGTGALTGGSGSTAQNERQRVEAMQRAAPALELEDVTMAYGGVKALDDLSLSIPEGSFTGVIGPNGSGKTTMFDVISGFQRPQHGTVRYQGIDISRQSAEQRAANGLIRRFQDARLFPSLTVDETLLLALDQQLTTKNAVVNASGIPIARRNEQKLRRRADHLIELLDLQAFRDKFVKELSTGLRRIVDIACTIARDPTLLLLDEPSSGIAQSEAEALAPLLKRIQFETGATIMVIEHDIPLLSRIADELIVLETGTLLARGLPEDVLNDDRVIEAYLGTSEAAVKRSGGLS